MVNALMRQMMPAKNGASGLRPSVATIDRGEFEHLCAELLNLASADIRPDALIGIRSGGFHVADAMMRASRGSIPVLPITCRRPSTGAKRKLSYLRGFVAGLPRPIVDQLRLLEHALIATRDEHPAPDSYCFDPDEVAYIADWLKTAGDRPNLLIVDDAVDSGVTLATVLAAIRRIAPPASSIRSAVITVTTERPLASPDYALFHRLLCRFPWSFDA